ncbi:SURF1 family protein [Comamonas composti]|uniref:SURF1 family protein n=1 Tax=Comamonas composti TaxID=408558 RepID=UPI0004132CBA|nr:SURF1 family protein [Comamonas composti]
MPERWRFLLISLAAMLGMAVTASLGRWQLQRAHDKEQRFQAMERQQSLRPWANADLAALNSPQAEEVPSAPWLHRPAILQGRWLAGQTVYLDNRQMQGRPGFFVLTPLRLAPPHEDLIVVVQRGWVGRNFQDRLALQPVETPAGLVEVRGQLEPPPSKLYELGAESAGAAPFHGADPDGQTPQLLQNVDFAAWAAASGLRLQAYGLVQTDAPSQGLSRDWPKATAGVEKHYGYAFQWFGLAALIALLYVWFQVLRRFIRPARA